MRVCIIPCRTFERSTWAGLIKAGLERHGEQVSIAGAPDRKADLHVVWGLKAVGKRLLSEGRPTLVIERAYLGDRFRWFALGYNGLNGKANFGNDEVSSDRWEQHWRPTMEPWVERDGYALVIGQVPSDAALYGADIYRWAEMVCARLKKQGREVVFRPHPLARVSKVIRGFKVDRGPLDEAFAGAGLVVTYSSNAAVEAVMAGIPTVAMHEGSMSWAVASHSLDEPVFKGDRDAWGARLAYAQWLPEELESGAFWDHLKSHYGPPTPTQKARAGQAFSAPFRQADSPRRQPLFDSP